MIDNKYKNIEKLCSVFFDNFNDLYGNYNKKNREYILKYINCFFKKWYYSTLIDNTELSPAFLVNKGGGDKKAVYPVLYVNNDKPDINILEYGIDDHPFLRDIRKAAELTGDVVRLNEDRTVTDRIFAQLKDSISICDKEYMDYIFMIGVEAGIFEQMPSLGVTALKLSENSHKYLSMNNRDMLAYIINAAMNIAAEQLSCYFMGSYCTVKWADIALWLSEPKTVDEIFSKYYYNGREIPDISEVIDDFAQMSRTVYADSFMLGLNIDKWFLTPFGYYLRLIDPCYLCNFSYYDEMEFFMAVHKEVQEHGGTMDPALYSPCTFYRLTELGAELYDTKDNDSFKESVIFETIEPNEVIDILARGKKEEYEKLYRLSIPKFNVMKIRIEPEDHTDKWFETEINVKVSLSYVHIYISHLFENELMVGQFFRFYKLPDSPFTQYKPSYLEQRGPKTDTTTMEELLEAGEECYYETELFDGSKVTYKITNLKISRRDQNIEYPHITGTGNL